MGSSAGSPPITSYPYMEIELTVSEPLSLTFVAVAEEPKGILKIVPQTPAPDVI